MSTSMRIGIIGVVFIALLALLSLRLWTMQITEVQAYEERALSNQVRVVSTPAPRGDIFDRNGVKLAGTRSALAAVVDLALVDQDGREPLAQNLAAFLDRPASEILDEMENDAQGAQLTIATDLTDRQATFIVEHKEEVPGVNVIPQPVRTYPLGEVGSHVLGYIGRPNEEDLERDDVKGNDFVGKAGVERSYDADLRGIEGIVQYQVDAKRKVLSLADEQAPTAGGSLKLTIDAGLQAQFQNSLRDGLILSRKLEMDERETELVSQSIPSRLADAHAEAVAEARGDIATEDETAEAATTTTAAVGLDDDDVAQAIAAEFPRDGEKDEVEPNVEPSG